MADRAGPREVARAEERLRRDGRHRDKGRQRPGAGGAKFTRGEYIDVLPVPGAPG